MNFENKNISKIEIVLENTDEITIYEDEIIILDMYHVNTTLSIDPIFHMDRNLHSHISCDELILGISSNANDYCRSNIYSNILNHDNNEKKKIYIPKSLFHMIKEQKNITSIDILFDTGEKIEIYAPWSDYAPMTNHFQYAQITKNGDLAVCIIKDLEKEPKEDIQSRIKYIINQSKNLSEK